MCNNGFGGSCWIILIIILILFCGNGNSCGSTFGNRCGCGDSCGCGNFTNRCGCGDSCGC